MKLLFVDYDRTLVAHNYPSYYNSSNRPYAREVYDMLSNSKDIFKKDKPMLCMKW